MDRKSWIAASVVVLCTALCLLGYLWANQLRLDVPGYGSLRPQGEMMTVRFGRQLIWLDAAGREQRHLDLADVGLVPTGDHAFFANGDLLLYHRPERARLSYWLARYLRLRKQSERAPRVGEGFYRCELPALACEPFGRGLPALDSAFHLALAADDTLFVADTPGFYIYRLAAGADQPERIGDGMLRFPNQIRLSEEGLWVADTNNRRLLLLESDGRAFGQVIREVSLRPQGALRWPHQFAAEGDGWLVNLADDRMRDGRIYRFSAAGEVVDSVAADLLVDPLVFELWNDLLWVVDAQSQHLSPMDVHGALLAETGSASLTSLELQAQHQRTRYLWLGRLFLAGMVLSLLAGFAAAWLLEREQTRAQFAGWSGRALAPLVAAEPAPIPSGQVHWLENRLKRRLRWQVPLILLVVAALAYALLRVLLLDGPWQLRFQMLVLALYAVLSLWLMMRDLLAAAQQRVGVSDEWLFLEAQGRQCRVAPDQVHYSRSHLVTPELVVFLGQPGHAVFDRAGVESVLFPRLKGASPCSPWAVWKALWHTRHPQAVLLLVLVPATVGLMLSLRLLA